MLDLSSLTGKDSIDVQLLHLLAYQTLLEYKCDFLPVRICDVLPNSKCKFISYSHLAHNFSCGIDYIYEMYGMYGAINYSCEESRYIVIYNKPQDRKELFYMHSLAIAYIELGFVKTVGFTPLSDENQAVREYANCLLAPNIVLQEAGIVTARAIMKATNLSFANALLKERQLKKERLTNLIHKRTIMEKLLLEQYSDFVERLQGAREDSKLDSK